MKAAVDELEKYLLKKEGASKGKLVLGTVYGDVHDIGKNLVKTIFQNNGYTVYDLGKQVPSQTGNTDSGQIPSTTVKRLREQNIDSKIDLYLSISNKPNFSKITKKLEANPKGFMTQVVQNLEQVQNLSDNLKGFSVIPIILFPSEKKSKICQIFEFRVFIIQSRV